MTAGDRVVVGVNAFTDESAKRIELHRVDPAGEERQRERTARVCYVAILPPPANRRPPPLVLFRRGAYSPDAGRQRLVSQTGVMG